MNLAPALEKTLGFGIKMNILFVCTGNSCRSQMAEGLANFLGEGGVIASSAGTNPVGVNPRSISCMKEVDIDISGQKSEKLSDSHFQNVDVVVTVCGNAKDHCPTIPSGLKHIHWPVEDPAHATGTEEEIMSEFRKAREDLKNRITELLN